MTREPACPVAYCPAPTDPDAHLCLHCKSNVVEHHHVYGRGKRKLDVTGIVIICRPLHEKVTLNKVKDMIWEVGDDRYYHVERGDEVLVHVKIPYGGGVTKSSFVHGDLPPLDDPTPPLSDPLDVMLAGKSGQRSKQPERSNPAGQLATGRESPGLLAAHGVSLTPTGLTFSTMRPLAYEEWAEVVAFSVTMRRTFQWGLADSLIYGEDVVGEEHSQILSSVAETPETIANWCSVARAWPHSFRHERLSFGHHQAIATIARRDIEEAVGWLLEAEAQGWSAKELREHAGLTKEREARKVQCPNCGEEFQP